MTSSKRCKTKMKDVPGSLKERMKKAFNECLNAVVNCEEGGTGRKRCELFREIPDRRVSIPFPVRSIAAFLLRSGVGVPRLLPANRETHRLVHVAETHQLRGL